MLVIMRRLDAPSEISRNHFRNCKPSRSIKDLFMSLSKVGLSLEGSIADFLFFFNFVEILFECSYNVIKKCQGLIHKDVVLTNPCFCIFGNVFHVLHFLCAHFQIIFSFN